MTVLTSWTMDHAEGVPEKAEDNIATYARRTLDALLVHARPTWEAHAGDLFFDYEGLRTRLRTEGGPTLSFYWGVRPTGTTLVFTDCGAPWKERYDDRGWAVTVTREDRSYGWRFTVSATQVVGQGVTA